MKITDNQDVSKDLTEPDAPYYTRRVYRLWMVSNLAVVTVIMAATQIPSLIGWLTQWTSGWALPLRLGAPILVVSVPMLVWLVLLIRWEQRTVRRLEAAGFRLCPRCAYPLTGHTGPVTCPECGERCNVEEVELAWRGFRPRITGVIGR